MNRFRSSCNSCRSVHVKCVGWSDVDGDGNARVGCSKCVRSGKPCVFQVKRKPGPRTDSASKKRALREDVDVALASRDVVPLLELIFGDIDTVKIQLRTGETIALGASSTFDWAYYAAVFGDDPTYV